MAYKKLIDLVRKFDSGVLELPLMQRDYVWATAKVVDLLDSLYKGWPIGVFYIWETPTYQTTRATAIRENERAGKRITEPHFGYLLDGQQRLTSLCRALDDRSGDNIATRAFFDVRKCAFVMGSKTVTISKRIKSDDPTLVPLSILIPIGDTQPQVQEQIIQDILVKLIDKAVITNSSKDLAEYGEKLRKVSKMLDTEVPCELFKTGDSDSEVDDAIELFKRLNKGGKSLSKADAEAATLTHKATSNIVPLMRDFVHIDDQKRLGLNFVFATRALITVHRNSASFSTLPKDWAMGPNDINKSWETTKTGLERAINFVREELGWTTRRWLPSANALIPLAYLLANRRILKKEMKDIRRYLCITGIRGLFRGSVESTINKYIGPVRRATSTSQKRASLILKIVTKNERRRIEAEDILGEHGMYSPLMQLYLAYLVSCKAKTWGEEAPLLEIAKRDINDPLSVHHIFPRELLRKNNIKPNLINCMANYAIISQADNARFGDEHPRNVYMALEPRARDYADMQLFHILSEEREWITNYPVFLKMRADALAVRLNDFLNLS